MTIKTCKEMVTEELAFTSVEKGNTLEFDRTFLCVSDNATDRPVNAWEKAASTYGLAIGAAYPNTQSGDVASYLKNVKVSRHDEDGLTYIVTVHYGQFPFGATSNDPAAQPAQWTVSGRTFQEIVDVDANGSKVLNSAGDPFIPGVVRDLDRALITVNQCDSSFNAYEELSYANCINSNSFLGFPAYTLKLPYIGVQAKWDSQYGWRYYKSYPFEYNAGPNINGQNIGWKTAILDAGLYEIDNTGTGDNLPIMRGGNPVQSPVMLDGSGNAANQGATPYYMQFQLYQALDFSFSFRGINA
jgi:hypothetical protein